MPCTEAARIASDPEESCVDRIDVLRSVVWLRTGRRAGFEHLAGLDAVWGLDDDLGGIGDELAAAQGVLHAYVVHGDAVADPDGAEFDGGAAGHVDPVFDRPGDAVQMGMAGDDRVGRIGHADQGALDFIVRVADCFEQGSVRCAFDAFFDVVALHGVRPVSFPLA